MLKLATILDNPGEPFAESRYRDPHELRRMGFNGVVLYETTGLSGLEGPDSVSSGELRRWVAQQYDIVRQRVEAARAAGLEVYLSYDCLSLARDLVNRQVAALTCTRRASTLCPASEAALEHSGKALESLLQTIPGVRGVVLRVGDNDAARVPYLVGNDVYTPHCARCSRLGRADRLALVMQHFHRLVVERHNLRLIARAWNVRPNGLHDSVELCRRVVERLPGAADGSDDRFILSFKVTHTDFWRYQKWNPASLACGRRPILYELQCQREFEGKGGIPNWQVPLWRDGCAESRENGAAAGLAQAAQQANLAGLWAWVRGGGWGGPFVRDENWIDANAFAVPLLADNPAIEAAELARRWVRQRLNVTDETVAAALVQALVHSPEVIRRGFYLGPYARMRPDPWHPNADWIQDDLVDAQAAWRIIQQLPDPALDELTQEKQQAVDQLAADRSALQQLVRDNNRSTLEPLVNTMLYGESLFSAMRDLLAGLAAYRRFLKSRDRATAAACRARLSSAQHHWTQHTQRHGSLPGAATSFREAKFWELTQKVLGEVE